MTWELTKFMSKVIPQQYRFQNGMNPSRLYIIGNGFDLYHGMKSRYWDFKDYLSDKDADLVERLEKYFGEDSLWSDFEGTLADLDTEEIIDECMNYLESYSAENWRDSGHHDYQYEVQKRVDIITETLKQRFSEWISQLRLPENAADDLLSVNKDSVFINFNYTNTLEKLYKIPFERILYIHNKCTGKDSTLLLGHGRKPKDSDARHNEDADIRVVEGNKILDDYFIKTYKPTKTIITENVQFFDSLKELRQIYVFGHSMSEVDLPYFYELLKRIDKTQVKWKVSFHSLKERMKFKRTFDSFRINPDLIELDRIYHFDDSQLGLF